MNESPTESPTGRMTETYIAEPVVCLCGETMILIAGVYMCPGCSETIADDE